ncbi:transmembrane protein 17-like [Protopterus annectens]|uniref:transmembrane protein 17-like n=1 Tax=Protopterus annectens TaxID=7888 RepID=UPI001CFADF53|nr:transmembrane protein 17-like [Protopterus annectens]
MFSIWAQQNNNDPFQATISDILEFLTKLFNEGDAAATSRVQLAAISYFHLGASENGGNEIISSLPLQMSLYFNVFFFPFWWVSEVIGLQLKYPVLQDFYKFIIITIVILMTLIEIIRLYLGYMGNLQEKVPELAGFWLLSLLLQLPLILFLLLNEGIEILPLERAVHIVFTLFLTFEVAVAFMTLKRMVNHLATRFHMRQFDDVEDLRPVQGNRETNVLWGTGIKT